MRQVDSQSRDLHRPFPSLAARRLASATPPTSATSMRSRSACAHLEKRLADLERNRLEQHGHQGDPATTCRTGSRSCCRSRAVTSSRQAHRRDQERRHQRAVLPGSLSGQPDHARRDDPGGPGPGGGHPVVQDLQPDSTQNLLYYFVGIDKARFKKPVIPGDQLMLDVTMMRSVRGIGKFTAGRGWERAWCRGRADVHDQGTQRPLRPVVRRNSDQFWRTAPTMQGYAHPTRCARLPADRPAAAGSVAQRTA